MTALSAPSATGTVSPPNSPSTAPQNAVHVRIAGSDRTYEVRDVLRGMGLRWDPLSHAWHGSLPPTARAQVERDLGLPVQLVRALDSFPAGPEPPEGPRPAPAPGQWTPRRRVHDGSRSRLESRVAIPREEDAPEPQLRRFSLADVTSGLPDDSREADERAAARHLADLRGRVKAARAAIARSPGAAEALLSDPARAARLCTRFGITPQHLRHGVPPSGVAEEAPDPRETPPLPVDGLAETRAREGTPLPSEEAH